MMGGEHVFHSFSLVVTFQGEENLQMKGPWQ